MDATLILDFYNNPLVAGDTVLYSDSGVLVEGVLQSVTNSGKSCRILNNTGTGTWGSAGAGRISTIKLSSSLTKVGDYFQTRRLVRRDG
jgi:hypothetical protein